MRHFYCRTGAGIPVDGDVIYSKRPIILLDAAIIATMLRVMSIKILADSREVRCLCGPYDANRSREYCEQPPLHEPSPQSRLALGVNCLSCPIRTTSYDAISERPDLTAAQHAALRNLYLLGMTAPRSPSIPLSAPGHPALQRKNCIEFDPLSRIIDPKLFDAQRERNRPEIDYSTAGSVAWCGLRSPATERPVVLPDGGAQPFSRAASPGYNLQKPPPRP